MGRKRIVVVAPGRGCYTKETMGYLEKQGPRAQSFLDHLDGRKQRLNEASPCELDTMDEFKSSVHTKGEHASILIYACSGADFISLNQDEYEIVAITGNSMGWYIAMALAGALHRDAAFDVINTMGSMMKDKLIGGQIIYPWVDENWHYDLNRRLEILNLVEEINSQKEKEVYLSIDLGGYVVIGGNRSGLSECMKRLPKIEHFPFQLINHGAFHTPMMHEVSERAFKELKPNLFNAPEVPLVDGRGHIWQAYSTDSIELRHYTLGHQVHQPYNYTAAIEVALKEFAPDQVLLLGPGNTLGAATGQIMVNNKWHGLSSKSEFIEQQKKQEFVVSMGLMT